MTSLRLCDNFSCHVVTFKKKCRENKLRMMKLFSSCKTIKLKLVRVSVVNKRLERFQKYIGRKFQQEIAPKRLSVPSKTKRCTVLNGTPCIDSASQGLLDIYLCTI